MSLSLLSLFAFVCLVEVQSHDVPYLIFQGEFIANHSYVNASLLEMFGDAIIRCYSDLYTCCLGNPDRGYWYFPNGSTVQNLGNAQSVYTLGNPLRIELRRRSEPLSTSAEGIYCCEVPTLTSESERAYVGLYSREGGNITVSGNVKMTVGSDLNGASPQFTLACISTGGPATTVTWTRDSTTVSEVTATMLENLMTSQYTHTLTVTGRLGGLYTCTVQNNKPSMDSAQITVQDATAPEGITLVQDGPSTVMLSWSPSSDATGYRIHYDNSGGDSGSEDISDGSTDSHTLTGLQRGETYSISIFATSTALPSETRTTMIRLVNIPKKPVFNMDAIQTTSTNIFIFWTIPTDVSYSEVTWRQAESGPVNGASDNIGSSGRLSTDTNSFRIEDLKSGTSYTIDLTVSNPAGNSSVELTQSTNKAEQSSESPLATIAGSAAAAVIIVLLVAVILTLVFVIIRKYRGKASAPSTRCVDVSSATPMDMSNLNEPSVMRSNDAYDTAVDEEAVADEHGYETVH